MNTSDTPETDAVAQPSSLLQYETVTANLARRLERERDEAREKYFAMRDLHTNATELAEKYKRERDEAREAAARWEAVALREASINGLRICGKEGAK